MGKSCVEEDNRPPPKGWPEDGSVELDDIYFDYRNDAPCALNGVSVTIESGQKIGVCGRTGAGKSTMISVLFSLGPLKSGKVTLGGHDVSVHAPRGCWLLRCACLTLRPCRRAANGACTAGRHLVPRRACTGGDRAAVAHVIRR